MAERVAFHAADNRVNQMLRALIEVYDCFVELTR
jgi:hypothetical protein